jgi:Spy/CpxP family protein refolding chaperone
MKLNRIITLCAMAATLALSATSLLAQDNNADQPGGPGGGRRNRQGGPGGPGGGGNFDPAQMQQRMLERVQEQLGFTNDVEWDAVKPLVQKVMDARREVGMGGMGRMFGGGRRGGQGGGPGGMFGQTSPEQEALQKALDDNAPASQVKDLLAKYKASQKAKQAKLEEAQANLKAVLTPKQEAQAYLLSLVN